MERQGGLTQRRKDEEALAHGKGKGRGDGGFSIGYLLRWGEPEGAFYAGWADEFWKIFEKLCKE